MHAKQAEVFLKYKQCPGECVKASQKSWHLNSQGFEKWKGLGQSDMGSLGIPDCAKHWQNRNRLKTAERTHSPHQ